MENIDHDAHSVYLMYYHLIMMVTVSYTHLCSNQYYVSNILKL